MLYASLISMSGKGERQDTCRDQGIGTGRCASRE